MKIFTRNMFENWKVWHGLIFIFLVFLGSGAFNLQVISGQYHPLSSVFALCFGITIFYFIINYFVNRKKKKN